MTEDVMFSMLTGTYGVTGRTYSKEKSHDRIRPPTPVGNRVGPGRKPHRGRQAGAGAPADAVRRVRREPADRPHAGGRPPHRRRAQRSAVLVRTARDGDDRLGRRLGRWTRGDGRGAG